MKSVWTVLKLLRWTTEYFERHGIDTPRLDAELLLAHVLDAERIDLYLAFDEPVGAADRARFRELVRRRVGERVPVAYLVETREFWSRPFKVTPDVLIPRPETECLVQAAVERQPRLVLDIGVGSGAVAGALALSLPAARIVGVELSVSALAVGRANLLALGVMDRVLLVRGDCTEAFRGPVDLIVANPPYIPRGELAALPAEVQHEPRLALDGGPDGLSFYRRIAAAAPSLLAERGGVVLEVGAGQAASVEALCRGAGACSVAVHKDLAGEERVVVACFEWEKRWTAS